MFWGITIIAYYEVLAIPIVNQVISYGHGVLPFQFLRLTQLTQPSTNAFELKFDKITLH
jgi:hypothetical protein